MQSKIKIKLKGNLKWIIFFLVTAIFIILSKRVLTQEVFALDEVITNFVSKFQTPMLTNILKLITDLMSFPALIAICLIVYLLPASRKNGNVVVLNLVTVTSINAILKIFFARERPFENALIEEIGYSFPSGHSMTSMAFFGLFIYLIYHSKLKKKEKILTISLFSCLILLIGISRIYLGVHYPSDVIGGFVLSIAYLILFTQIVKIRRRKKGV